MVLRQTYHVAVRALLIEELTRLPHRHADELILAIPATLTALTSASCTSTGEHLKRLHGCASAESLAIVLLALAATSIYSLMSLDSLRLIDV